MLSKDDTSLETDLGEKIWRLIFVVGKALEAIRLNMVLAKNKSKVMGYNAFYPLGLRMNKVKLQEV